MALVVKDRVKETTTTTGTGTITLAGAADGYQSFSVIGNGNTTYYAIVGDNEWEVGVGTYTASGTTLSRDTVLESSNSGNAVNFSSGEKQVFCTYPAEKAVYLDASGNFNISDGDITFGDNDKAIFGAGSDLQIYHDGSNSVISEAGTGVLEVRSNGTEVQLTGNSGTDYMLRAKSNNSVDLYYDNSKKLATTSTGVDVTGTVTATGALRAGANIDDTPNGTQFTHVLGSLNSGRVVYFDGIASNPSVWWGWGNSPYGAIDADQNYGLRMWYNNTSGSWSEQFRVGNQYTESLVSARSPYYYSNANTAYYTNPAGTSNVVQLNAGVLTANAIRVGTDSVLTEEHLGSLSVDHGNSTDTKYYKIAEIGANNGNVKVKGTIGGHDLGTSQGAGAVDISVFNRSGTTSVTGTVEGQVGNQDLLIYRDGSNNLDIYVKSVTWSLIKLEYSAASGGTIYHEANADYPFNSAPTGTLVWQASSHDSENGSTNILNEGYVAGNRILTTADEGSGSNLDADTVDGIQASSFLRSDVADTASEQITFSKYSRHNYGLEANLITLGGDGSNTASLGQTLQTTNNGVLYLNYTSTGNISCNNGGTGYLLGNTSVRSPIFYDSNDTSAYWNGAGGNSRMGRDLYISGWTSGNYGNRLVVGNTDVTYSLQDTNRRPTIQAHGAYPVLSLNHTVTTNTGHGPTVQFTSNGTGNQFVIGTNGTGTQLDIGTSNNTSWNPHNGINGYLGTTGFRMDTSGNVYNYVSTRSPIYYDSNNTGYYADPASTSVFNVLTVNSINGRTPIGTIGQSQSVSGSGWYRVAYNNGSVGRGEFKISLYTTGGNYTPSTIEVHGFRDWSGTGRIMEAKRSGSFFSSVRITSDGTNSWLEVYFSSAVVFTAIKHPCAWDAYTLYSGALSAGGNTAYDTVSLEQGHNSLRYNAASDVRAPIFYDTNNTSYYVDPYSASVLNGLRLTGANGNNVSGSDYILWIDKPNNNDWAFGITGGQEYNFMYSGAASHTYGIRGLANGSEYFRVGTDLAYHNASFRAPIFYDSNNTGYYSDPSSTSNFNHIRAYRITSADGQDIVIAAGESDSYANEGSFNDEYIHLLAESGLHIASSPDNWSSGWAGRKEAYICNPNGNSSLPGDLSLSGDLTVTGGDIVLGGTGRIQGVDTVTDNTDAANKLYVDNAVANGSGGGEWELLETYTCNNTVSEKKFSWTAGDYSAIKLTFTDLNATVDATALYFRIGHSGGTMITSSNYYYTQMLSTSTSLSNQSGTSLGWRLGTLGIGSYLGETGSGEITFYISQRQNGSNVVSNGVGVQGAFHYEASNGFGYGYKMVGNLWNPNNTTPYDTVSIRFSSGYLEEGTILVWGRA